MSENKNDYGGHLTWEWYKGKIKKAWRDKHNHVWVQLLFPGDDEESKVDLSDGKKLKYLTDWVLLSEQKEGGMARQKKAKMKHAAVSSSSGKKAPLPDRPSPSRLQAQGKEEEAVGGGVVLVRVFCGGSCLCGVLKKVAHQHQRTRARKPLVLF